MFRWLAIQRQCGHSRKVASDQNNSVREYNLESGPPSVCMNQICIVHVSQFLIAGMICVQSIIPTYTRNDQIVEHGGTLICIFLLRFFFFSNCQNIFLRVCDGDLFFYRTFEIRVLYYIFIILMKIAEISAHFGLQERKFARYKYKLFECEKHL